MQLLDKCFKCFPRVESESGGEIVSILFSRFQCFFMLSVSPECEGVQIHEARRKFELFEGWCIRFSFGIKRVARVITCNECSRPCRNAALFLVHPSAHMLCLVSSV